MADEFCNCPQHQGVHSDDCWKYSPGAEAMRRLSDMEQRIIVLENAVFVLKGSGSEDG